MALHWSRSSAAPEHVQLKSNSASPWHAARQGARWEQISAAAMLLLHRPVKCSACLVVSAVKRPTATGSRNPAKINQPHLAAAACVLPHPGCSAPHTQRGVVPVWVVRQVIRHAARCRAHLQRVCACSGVSTLWTHLTVGTMCKDSLIPGPAVVNVCFRTNLWLMASGDRTPTVYRT